MRKGSEEEEKKQMEKIAGKNSGPPELRPTATATLVPKDRTIRKQLADIFHASFELVKNLDAAANKKKSISATVIENRAVLVPQCQRAAWRKVQ